MTWELVIRLAPEVGWVNNQIVKGGLMADPTPKRVEQDSHAILCPICLRRSAYIASIDTYCCPKGHGAVITGEELYSYFKEARE